MLLKQYIQEHGHGAMAKLARETGINVRYLWKWQDAGRLPRTVLTGEQPYAHQLAEAMNVPVDAILAETRDAWQKKQVAA